MMVSVNFSLFTLSETVLLVYVLILQEVTALEFDSNGGFLMGVGSSTGKVIIILFFIFLLHIIY